MPLLQVRDFPQDLYERLAQVATAERRSIAQQATVLLGQALTSPESALSRRQRVLAEATELAHSMPPNDLDPVVLIRQDRDR